MVDWKAPKVQELCAFTFAQLTVFFLGVYIWYFILTLPRAELRLFAGRIRFKPAHIPYLVARYCHMISLVGLVVQTHLPAPIVNCGGLVFLRSTAVCANMALSAASANIGFRALTVWKDKAYIVGGIMVVAFVHIIYGIALGVIGVKTSHTPEHYCTIIMTDTRYELLAFFIFTVCWDLAILALTLIGLRRRQSQGHRSPLVSLLFKQGVVYTLISSITCIPLVAFALIDLTTLMDLFVVPGTTISVIASSTSVTSLLKAGASGVQRRSITNGEVPGVSRPDGGELATSSGQMLTSYLDSELYTAGESSQDPVEDKHT